VGKTERNHFVSVRKHSNLHKVCLKKNQLVISEKERITNHLNYSDKIFEPLNASLCRENPTSLSMTTIIVFCSCNPGFSNSNDLIKVQIAD
jgi:hypothetical protein